MDSKFIFDRIVEITQDYIVTHNLNSMVLGISGGIDSTVVAAVCREVNRRTGIPFIGRSLPMKNSGEEINAAKLVGKAFCSDFKEVPLGSVRDSFLKLYETDDNIVDMTLLADGNVQARLRMTYLYNIAGLTKGIVLDTDNYTENLCGFWTKHGDVGDFKPIAMLFKTEVFELARYLADKFKEEGDNDAVVAMEASLALKPTDGLGISDGDEEQLGAPYEEVDDIFKILMTTWPPIQDSTNLSEVIPEAVEKYGDKVQKIHDRHVRTQYKRLNTPVIPLHVFPEGKTMFSEINKKQNEIILANKANQMASLVQEPPKSVE